MKLVEQDTSQDLAVCGQEGDTSVVVTKLATVFSLTDVDNAHIFQLLWDLPFIR